MVEIILKALHFSVTPLLGLDVECFRNPGVICYVIGEISLPSEIRRAIKSFCALIR